MTSVSAEAPLLLALEQARPQVSEDVFVAPGVTVVGDVRVAARTSLWYGAVLRGDGDLIDVGPGCNIQDGCVLHADPGFGVRLGSGVSVGHRAVVHGCHIGDNVLVGMGAVLMNGVRVQDDVLIAAGTVLLEGTEVPARSLVAGVPGKVRRPLTDDEVSSIRENATGYEQTARRHVAARRL